jgi:hypothetical protein
MINLIFPDLNEANMKPQILFPIIFFIFSHNCLAGNEFNLAQLSWLTGCWKGTGLGGEVEECWVKSHDNRYTSVFQMTEGGQQRFSEIVMIADFNDQPAMRVKHFDASFKQWESDKSVGVTFPFVEIGKNFIQFEGLRYELVDGTLHVTLDMKRGDDTHTERFVYRRN